MKTHMTCSRLLSTLVFLVVSGVYAASVNSVLLGLWRFDEPDGSVAQDSSGLHHDGTLMRENGNVPVRVAGQPGFGGVLQSTGSVPGGWQDEIGVTSPHRTVPGPNACSAENGGCP